MTAAFKLPKPLQRWARRRFHDLCVLRSFKRPEWLVRLGVRIPAARITMSEVQPTPEDVVLCGRLIEAYTKACANAPPAASEAWSRIIVREYGALQSVLRQGDAVALAVALSTMFRASCVYGIAHGDLYSGGPTRRIWELKLLDDLVSLGEFLAVTRVENPEQGRMGAALDGGVDALVDRIEEKLAGPIGFPSAGSPYGFVSRGRLITMEAPEYIYVATRVRDAILHQLPEVKTPTVLEIGAGFGGLAYCLLRLFPAITRYVTIDLPIINVLQGYFLSKALGTKGVSLFGEPGSSVQVLPTTAIQQCSADVLINENSMPEMPADAVHAYLRWAEGNLRGIFYSYQQEAWTPQVWVAQAVAKFGTFRLLSRNPSWVRRGYVEEVYSVGALGPPHSIAGDPSMTVR